jgi:hypothetical protein
MPKSKVLTSCSIISLKTVRRVKSYKGPCRISTILSTTISTTLKMKSLSSRMKSNLFTRIKSGTLPTALRHSKIQNWKLRREALIKSMATSDTRSINLETLIPKKI